MPLIVIGALKTAAQRGDNLDHRFRRKYVILHMPKRHHYHQVYLLNNEFKL